MTNIHTVLSIPQNVRISISCLHHRMSLSWGPTFAMFFCICYFKECWFLVPLCALWFHPPAFISLEDTVVTLWLTDGATVFGFYPRKCVRCGWFCGMEGKERSTAQSVGQVIINCDLHYCCFLHPCDVSNLYPATTHLKTDIYALGTALLCGQELFP